MIRWGLLGTAHINRRLIPAMRAARRSTIVAVAARDPDRARRYADEWHIPVAHAGYDALLHDATVDAIYVPLPNALHVEWTLRALDAGKHVLCEKPLALRAGDVDRIASLAAANERVVAEGFMYRHEPLAARLVELVRGGAVGPVHRIASGFSFQQSREHDVRLDPALGGGCLWDIGCYCASVTRLLCGAEPLEAFGWASLAPTGVDERFTGTLRFPDGIIGTLDCSFRSPARAWVEITGRDGVIRVADPFRPPPRAEIEVWRGDQAESVVVEGSPLHFVREVEDFAAAVLDGRAPAVSLSESRGNVAALAALQASARTGRAVAI